LQEDAVYIMKDFFEKPLDDLIKGNVKKSTGESYEKVMERIILEDYALMKQFGRSRSRIVYPQSIGPQWKN